MAGKEVVGDDDPKRRCVFLARYKKIGVNQWIRIARPEIDISDDPWPDTYRYPQVCSLRENKAEVRVKDDNAVSLQVDSLLGDYSAAAERCNKALLQAFPGDVIVDNQSSW